ncbi:MULTISPECIES: NAD(P)(+) transhydrogenase (Re/Si-specific) subunit beta [Cupriavidus]
MADDRIFQRDNVNAEFADADVVLVVDANDMVNPAADTDKTSSILGMPVLNVDVVKKVYVVKRSEGKGYAGIVNAVLCRQLQRGPQRCLGGAAEEI